jgi:hypothetical protein
VESGRNDESRTSENHERGRSLSGGHLEFLFLELESSCEEGATENEEQVGEDRTEEGGLNDSEFSSNKGEDTDNQFDLFDTVKHMSIPRFI